MDIWGLIDAFSAELLLFCAFSFAVGAIDDLAVDFYYLGHRFRRWRDRYRRHRRMSSAELPPADRPGLIAIFVPAWQEDAVIGQMLRLCLERWRGCHYRIYVGCYPNDARTVSEVMNAASGHRDRIRLVINDKDGPTTKADCLNRLWIAMQEDETGQGVRVKAVALHDAEDVVHPDEIRIYDRLIEKKELVQIPVLPLTVKGSRWVSGHYCDEFAESHAKQMVVREALGVGMPSSGVGCAFDRDMLERLMEPGERGPFNRSSLTEDYELGIRIAGHGGRAMMVRMRDRQGRLVATRSCFPETLTESVRQKARWMNGIALAGWDRIGWNRNWRECWMRLHDRRGIFAAVVLTAAYLSLCLEVVLLLSEVTGLYRGKPVDPLLRVLLLANLAVLLWRFVMRFCFVARFYGLREGLYSIPRMFVANIISIIAARRALWDYVRHLRGAPLRWDKTSHKPLHPTHVA